MNARSFHLLAPMALTAFGILLATLTTSHAPRSVGDSGRPFFANHLDTTAAKFLAMGYRGTAASLTWVRVVFDYVDVQMEGGGANFDLEPGLSTVVALDPSWRVPYEFAGLVLEDEPGRPSPTAIQLLRRGCEKFPEDWRMRVYLGMGLLARGDTLLGKRELAKLTTIAGQVPPYIRELGVSSVHRIGGDREAVSNLLVAMQIAPDPLTNLGLIKKLSEILERRGVVGAADSARAIESVLRSGDEEAKARWIRWLYSMGGSGPS